MEESQDLSDNQDIDINVIAGIDQRENESDHNQHKREKKTKWNKGEFAMRNGEKVEIIQYDENDDCYEV